MTHQAPVPLADLLYRARQALATSDGLTNRGNLADGDVLISPLAAEFVRAFVTGTTPLPPP